VQVDPIKPTLKAPGTERLELKYEELLSNFGLKINLRRYHVKWSATATSHNDFFTDAIAGGITTFTSTFSTPLTLTPKP